MINDEFWKRKLMAFLHDPPCKCFAIHEHEKIAEGFRREAGITAEDYAEFDKICDRTAAAADRFPFVPGKCAASFDGSADSPFIHPLCSEKLWFSEWLPSAALAEEKFQDSIGSVNRDLDFKTKFFLYWRRWPEQAAQSDQRLFYLPADTRMPDHTIWNHMSITSALSNCVSDNNQLEASFLIFQLAPVQEFIEQARSTRDMWSGSYLISWLMAHALKNIADSLGPDAVIFPSLRGLPIFDLMFRDIYEKAELRDGNDLWKAMKYRDDDLLMPVIPNRFCAVVPSANAEDIAYAAQETVIKELNAISEAVLASFQKLAGDTFENNWAERWRTQVKLFPQITWQITPWFKGRSLNVETLEKLEKLAEAIPENDRDSRCYPLNSGFYWSANYRYCETALAARRNTREFQAFVTDDNQFHCPKDVFSGKEEIIGSEALWEKLAPKNNEGNTGQSELFKPGEMLGAMNLIKRLWCRNDGYLARRLGRGEIKLSFESLADVAEKNNNPQSPYVAVIALDGDEMGKFLSGAKTPKFLQQLAGKAPEYLGSIAAAAGIFDLHRPLTPAYHLQFSEALANFARHVAGEVVAAFEGQLIYSGGDDVLAVLPADRALACAAVLRSYFRGESCDLLKKSKHAVFLGGKSLKFDVVNPGWLKPEGKDKYPLMMPGTACDVSCGIAIAHKKYPLQRMIKEARQAEKRAKNLYHRGAFAISLLKRGGEIIHWGAKWSDKVLELFFRYSEMRREVDGEEPPVSGRFPYALAALLAPYELAGEFVGGFDPRNVIEAELGHVLERQVKREDIRQELYDLCQQYLTEIEKTCDEKNHPRYQDFVNLFMTAAFIERDRGE